MSETSDLTMWLAIQSFFLPVLVSVVQQPRWQPATRTLVAAVVFGLAGVGTTYFTSPDLFTAQTAVTAVLASIVAGTAAYKSVWKPLGISAVENATTRGGNTPA